MLRAVCFVAASLALSSAFEDSHAASLAACVTGCERKNECHTTLDPIPCEGSCKLLCECTRIARRVLNKPKHCMASMIAKHRKQLSLFRTGKVRVQKVLLKETDASEPSMMDIHVEDAFPHGGDVPEVAEKPRMLNGKRMSLLKSASHEAAMPWSAAARPQAEHHRSKRHAKAWSAITQEVSVLANQTSHAKSIVLAPPSKNSTAVPASAVKASKKNVTSMKPSMKTTEIQKSQKSLKNVAQQKASSITTAAANKSSSKPAAASAQKRAAVAETPVKKTQPSKQK